MEVWIGSYLKEYDPRLRSSQTLGGTHADGRPRGRVRTRGEGANREGGKASVPKETDEQMDGTPGEVMCRSPRTATHPELTTDPRRKPATPPTPPVKERQ